MKNKKIIINIFLFAGLALATGIAVRAMLLVPKIAYVRTNALINEYEGMIDAVEKYRNKVEKWQQKHDSINSRFRLEIANYKADSASYTRAEKLSKKELIRALHQKLTRIDQTMKAEINQEDEKLTSRIVEQMNSFIREYGKKNNYDIVFGTLETGNIIYGNEALDITDEVLLLLNEKYMGTGQQQ